MISSQPTADYVHLSGRDVDKALLKLHGIQRDDQPYSIVFKPVLREAVDRLPMQEWLK